jgi:4-carboxymuconolactone decarboxylase
VSEDVKTRTSRGLDVLRTLGGSAEAAEGMASFFESLGAVGQIALRVGAGEVWARTALSRRDRSLVVVSFLTALGREVELRAHIAGGLNHGLRAEEIDEIFVQIGAYAGAARSPRRRRDRERGPSRNARAGTGARPRRRPSKRRILRVGAPTVSSS